MSIDKAFEALVERSKKTIPINDGDYTGPDGLLYCGNCNTPKQKELVALGKVRRPYCLCKCEEKKRDEEEAERERLKLEKRIDDLRRKGFPDSEMHEWTFANDDMENEQITKAMKRYVENFPELRKQGKGLLLYGGVGGGKTYATCEVANALIDQGYSVLVTNFSRILNTLQSTFEKQEYLDNLNSFALLVIDDLGIERSTEFSKEQVYNVIDSRYRAGKPMLITTNLSIEQIKNPADIEDRRIYERILERCFPIEIKGVNRRRKKIRESYGDMKELLGL